MPIFQRNPVWVRVVTTAGEGLLSLDAILLVEVTNQESIRFVAHNGAEYQWRTNGTLAEYGALMQALRLSDLV